MTDISAPEQFPIRSSLPFPRSMWLAPSLLLLLAISGPNSFLGLYAVVVLVFGLLLLWRPGEPPILLFIFLYQWMQASTGAFYGNLINTPLADLHHYRGQHEFASALMLTGLFVLALAMRIAAGKPQLDLHVKLKTLVRERPFGFWVRIYAIAWAFSTACYAIAPMSGGLRVPILTMAEVKWAAFVLITFAAFSSTRPSAKAVWALIFVIEFILSVGGFWASFKEVFFFALFGLAMSNARYSRRVLIPGVLLAIAMVGAALAWTAVKGEFRSFVNAGSGQQVVLVDHGDRIMELGRLVGSLDGMAFQLAAEDLASRLMYHVFFGAAAENVPKVIPHTGGEIWGEAISRPFMPRLLFPDKRAIHDSDLTNQYTGLSVATADRGTSISMGYMADAYIDFGPVLMFVPIAVLGFGLGTFYRWLMRRRGSMALIGASLAPVALMPAYLVETSILKLVPSLMLTLLTSLVVIKILAPIVLRVRLRAK